MRGIRRVTMVAGLIVLIAPIGSTAAEPTLLTLEIEPAQTTLTGSRARARLLATGHYSDGTVRDLSNQATWTTPNAGVVTVEPGGLIHPEADGEVVLRARVDQVEATAWVAVRDTQVDRPIEFTHEVLPALTKAGCNQGACHGTPTGKNGFRLSLRGYDPRLDFLTLTREVGTRRTNPFDPESSLILLKGTGATPHEGGKRFTTTSPLYGVLRNWVAEGIQPDRQGSPTLEQLEVVPSLRILDDPARSQQLVVRARFSDGTMRDVTELARFSSTDTSVASVDDEGLVERQKRGEATILVSFEHRVATTRLVFRVPVPGLVWVDPPENNLVDRHVFARLKLLGIPPSDRCDDATFCRRVFLDVIGVIPTPEELAEFLRDTRPDKRSRLIDDLLSRSDYADYWGLKWADRLGCNQRYTGHKGAYSYHRWIRDQIAANVPFDQFVRAIVTAKGSNYSNPAASFYRRIRSPEDAVETVSQLFLGVRLQCARCHNHVAERWTQDDYYSMAAFFSQVRYKNGPQYYAQYNKEETVYLKADGEVVQPRTGQTMKPRALGTAAAAPESGRDRREALADWLVAPDNPFFARAAVNRVWYHLFGRGIVDPVDDMRESNPPAIPDLLDALAAHLVENHFDLKATIRLILESRTYQLSSETNRFNADDTRYFSHALVRLLSAEQLLDSASRATGVEERLFHLPSGTRAAQVPDGEFVHPFLRTFGQPLRSEACECERQSDSTLEQALQLVGGRTIHRKVVAEDNRIGVLLKAGVDDAGLVDGLFLATLGRHPSSAERQVAVSALSNHEGERRRAAEDLLWSLLNHPEFLFQH